MSKETNIYLDAPNIGIAEKEYLNKAIDSGYVSTIGPYVAEFEEEFARYLGIKGAVSTQSGTAAIHIALHELGIKKGDEVIVPALTFIATINPILYVGAIPVFVDVEPDTWNMDPVKVEENITSKTRAIMPVHFYGNPCNMSELIDIAKRRKIYVIEDATESLGATYRKKYTGTLGDLGCFSFNGNKIITTGGGGMVVGKNEKRLEHIKFLTNQARDKSDRYYHSEIGFNYRMTNLEAAMGLAQIKKIRDFLTKKRKFYEIYRKELVNLDGIGFQEECEGGWSSRWLMCVRFNRKIDMRALREKLKEKGIPTRRVFMPTTEFPPYKRYKLTDYPNSYDIYENGLCLPGSTLNNDESIFTVCKALKEFF